MKKISLIIIISVLFIQTQAQHKSVVFGLRAGGNLSWMKPDTKDYSSGGVKAGFSWGFLADFYLMENYSILTGFNMDFNGGKLEYPWTSEISVQDSNIITPGTMNRDYSLKYIQIPLCLKMQTALSEKVTIFGKIGVGTAFNLNAKVTDEFVYDDGTINYEKQTVSDEIALMRESLIVGGGVSITIKGSTAVIIDLTYDNAFNDILVGDNPYVSQEVKGVQNFVEIGAGIVF